MTRAAWLMMGATWSVITYFTARFFWRVLTLPPRPEESEPPPQPARRGRDSLNDSLRKP